MISKIVNQYACKKYTKKQQAKWKGVIKAELKFLAMSIVLDVYTWFN